VGEALPGELPGPRHPGGVALQALPRAPYPPTPVAAKAPYRGPLDPPGRCRASGGREAPPCAFEVNEGVPFGHSQHVGWLRAGGAFGLFGPASPPPRAPPSGARGGGEQLRARPAPNPKLKFVLRSDPRRLSTKVK